MQVEGLQDDYSAWEKTGFAVFFRIRNSQNGFLSLETSKSFGRDEASNSVSKSYQAGVHSFYKKKGWLWFILVYIPLAHVPGKQGSSMVDAVAISPPNQ